MKVLHFSSAKSWRGGEQQIAYLTTELQQLQIEQVVLCVTDAPLATFCQDQQIPFYTFKKRASIDPGPARLLAKIVKEEKNSIIHIHDAHAHTFAVMAAALFGLTVPLVLSRRVDFPIKQSFLSKWKYNHPSIKAILCVSGFIKKIITPDIDDALKIKVVHSGIDLSRFQNKKSNQLRSEFNIPDNFKIIGNVAAIAPHKDYFTFVDTAGLLLKKRDDLRFLIIGDDGGEESQIRNYIQQKGLKDDIVLTGFRKDISKILPELNLFLFTSKTEGLGTSLLDALACRVPVVATKTGGIPEIIDHEKCGLLATVGDSAHLAQYCVRLLDEPNLCQQFIENGLKKLQSFTKESTAQKTLAIYNAILHIES